MKLRKVEHGDLKVGVVLYNKNGTPRTITEVNIPKIGFATGAFYRENEIIHGDWRTECKLEEIISVLFDMTISGSIKSYKFSSKIDYFYLRPRNDIEIVAWNGEEIFANDTNFRDTLEKLKNIKIEFRNEIEEK